jgi:hypothetical protein
MAALWSVADLDGHANVRTGRFPLLQWGVSQSASAGPQAASLVTAGGDD